MVVTDSKTRLLGARFAQHEEELYLGVAAKRHTENHICLRVIETR